MAPSTNASGTEFEVFLSFRGSDTRDNFASCLYHDMVEKGIRVFRDDKELQVGEKIEELFKALDDSQLYIPIFSQDFASSAWCLDEVARMLDRTSKSEGKKEIHPIFLDVKANDVKSRKGSYSKALSKHEEERRDPTVVEGWRKALREVASRVGWKLEGKEYGELIKLIVRKVLLKLKGKNRRVPDHLVETSDLERVVELLDVESNDHVRFVIIHGAGGIGKSTLASVIFNRFRSKFGGSSFLEDVRSHSLLDMQKKLLSETLGSNSAQEIHDTNDGIGRITRGLGEKKVLVVVDDVDEKKQLDNLAGSCNWFGRGSRIIVTLRDIRIMRNKQSKTQPSNYVDFSVNEMPVDQAIQLFSNHAFRSDSPPIERRNFSLEVVSSIGRLPLTLEVVGSLFASKDRSEWDETLEELKQVPCNEVQDALKISIRKLDRREKRMFLDIACFCIGEDVMKACYMWDEYGCSPRSAVDDLLLMSLIRINEDNTFWMHDELRDQGRYIVKEENFADEGNRYWVKIDKKTPSEMRSNKRKRKERALSLGTKSPEEMAYWPELRFLGGERLNFVGDFKDLLPNLRWLSWRDCPPEFSATNLHLTCLVVLDLSYSEITDDWGGWTQIKMAKNLKMLDLTQCSKLTKTPNFSGLGKLEKLILRWCWNLRTIDSSIDQLKSLNTLDITGCASLEELPEAIGQLKSLNTLDITGCQSLEELPKEITSLERLSKIITSHDWSKHPEERGLVISSSYCSRIKEVPHSIGRLKNLTHLDLSHCKNLHDLPCSIGKLKLLVELDLSFSGISTLPSSIKKLKNLKRLFLFGCESLLELPDSIKGLESLIELYSSHLEIAVLPDSFGRLTSLTHLSFRYCENLLELPSSIGELKSLAKLDLRRSGISTLPDSIGGLKNLECLLLEGCEKVHKLPDSIRELKSLVTLDLKFTGISVLPDSIGSLTSLKYLGYHKNDLPAWTEAESWSRDVKISVISALPDSVGRLKNLKRLSFSISSSSFVKYSYLSGNRNHWSSWKLILHQSAFT